MRLSGLSWRPSRGDYARGEGVQHGCTSLLDMATLYFQAYTSTPASVSNLAPTLCLVLCAFVREKPAAIEKPGVFQTPAVIEKPL